MGTMHDFPLISMNISNHNIYFVRLSLQTEDAVCWLGQFFWVREGLKKLIYPLGGGGQGK